MKDEQSEPRAEPLTEDPFVLVKIHLTMQERDWLNRQGTNKYHTFPLQIHRVLAYLIENKVHFTENLVSPRLRLEQRAESPAMKARFPEVKRELWALPEDDEEDDEEGEE